MPQIKGASAWTFVTSSSGGIGVEFVAAEGGVIYLSDPTGKGVSFGFGAAGAGLSAGLKIPKLGKVHIPVKGKSITGNVGPASFPNTGCLYVLGGCPGSELTVADIQGGVIFVEVWGGLIAGGSAMAMLMGCSVKWMAVTLAAGASSFVSSYTSNKVIEFATALLLVAGINAGVQAGVGINGYVGGLY